MSADDEIEMAVARLSRIAPGSSPRRTLKGRIRAMMPAIEEARGKQLSWKEIHAEIAAAGIQIEPQILANYVCEARRDARLDALKDGRSQDSTSQAPVVVQLPRRGKFEAPRVPLQFRRERAGKASPDSTTDPAVSAPDGVNSQAAPVPGQVADQYVETLNGGRPTKVSRPR